MSILCKGYWNAEREQDASYRVIQYDDNAMKDSAAMVIHRPTLTIFYINLSGARRIDDLSLLFPPGTTLPWSTDDEAEDIYNRLRKSFKSQSNTEVR